MLNDEAPFALLANFKGSSLSLPMTSYQEMSLRGSVVDCVKGSRSNLVVMHGDEVASSPLRFSPFAPRNDIVFYLSFQRLQIS